MAECKEHFPQINAETLEALYAIKNFAQVAVRIAPTEQQTVPFVYPYIHFMLVHFREGINTQSLTQNDEYYINTLKHLDAYVKSGGDIQLLNKYKHIQALTTLINQGLISFETNQDIFFECAKTLNPNSAVSNLKPEAVAALKLGRIIERANGEEITLFHVAQEFNRTDLTEQLDLLEQCSMFAEGEIV